MSINVNINLDVNDSADSIASLINGSNGVTDRNLQGVSTLISALSGGMRSLDSGRITITTKATALITFTGTPVADETITINGVVFTAKASGTVANTFVLSATVGTSATNLASAINASVSAGIAHAVTASASAGVCIITAIGDGYSALGFTISESMTGTAATAWATTTKTANITI